MCIYVCSIVQLVADEICALYQLRRNGESDDGGIITNCIYDNGSIIVCCAVIIRTHVHKVCVEKVREGARVCCDSVDAVPKATFITQKKRKK